MRFSIGRFEMYGYRDRPGSPVYAGVWVGEWNREVAI